MSPNGSRNSALARFGPSGGVFPTVTFDRFRGWSSRPTLTLQAVPANCKQLRCTLTYCHRYRGRQKNSVGTCSYMFLQLKYWVLPVLVPRCYHLRLHEALCCDNLLLDRTACGPGLLVSKLICNLHQSITYRLIHTSPNQPIHQQ